jgi:hypothetical protein
MKKILLLTITLVFMLWMVGCTQTKKSDESSQNVSGDMSSSTTSSDNTSEKSTDSDETEIPSEDEVVAQYEKATEAASWFRINSLQFDSNDAKEYNGNTYYRVTQYGTLTELTQYLHSLFSDDLVSSFLKSNDYVEIDGALYTLGGARGTDITKGKESYAVSQVSDTKLMLTVTVEVYGDDLSTVETTETHEFSYELDNGEWVFTSFPAIR